MSRIVTHRWKIVTSFIACWGLVGCVEEGGPRTYVTGGSYYSSDTGGYYQQGGRSYYEYDNEYSSPAPVVVRPQTVYVAPTPAPRVIYRDRVYVEKDRGDNGWHKGRDKDRDHGHGRDWDRGDKGDRGDRGDNGGYRPRPTPPQVREFDRDREPPRPREPRNVRQEDDRPMPPRHSVEGRPTPPPEGRAPRMMSATPAERTKGEDDRRRPPHPRED